MNYPAIQNHGTLKQSVDARELHKSLEIGKDFSNWIKQQINRLNLVEHADYEVYALQGENQNGGRPRANYALTVEAAKNISMISFTAKGQECRDYFIECEKKASGQRIALPSRVEAIEQMLALAKKVDSLECSNQNKDKLLIASNEASIKAGEILVRQFAKSIDFIDVGQNKMFAWLKERGFLMTSNEPYQVYVNRGWFTWKPTKEKCNGEFRYTVRITPRGKVKLTSLYMDQMDQCEALAA